MKMLYITLKHAMYFVKYKTHSALNSPKHTHIVNGNVYKKYISHTAKDIFSVAGAETTFAVLVTPLSCTKCLDTEGATLTTV